MNANVVQIGGFPSTTLDICFNVMVAIISDEHLKEIDRNPSSTSGI